LLAAATSWLKTHIANGNVSTCVSKTRKLVLLREPLYRLYCYGCNRVIPDGLSRACEGDTGCSASQPNRATDRPAAVTRFRSDIVAVGIFSKGAPENPHRNITDNLDPDDAADP
jgi:hypothetical protein